MSWVVADDLPSTILFSFPSEGSIKIVNASQRRRRRQRRLQQRSDDKYRKLHRYIDFQQTFGFDALYQAARKCKRGVTWKNTVLNFDNRRAVNCWKLAQELEDGTYKKRAPIRFDYYATNTGGEDCLKPSTIQYTRQEENTGWRKDKSAPTQQSSSTASP